MGKGTFIAPAFALACILCHGQFSADRWASQNIAAVTPQQSPEIEETYDETKDKTTIRLAPVKIYSGQDRYVSLHMSPSFSFTGRRLLATPAIIDFELRTVVRGRLRTDLYVIFLVDGEKIFLSSNRWAVRKPVPGRVWMGEHLVFRMPYETFVKITKAITFEIKFDATTFSVGAKEKQAMRDFLILTKPNRQITRIARIRKSSTRLTLEDYGLGNAFSIVLARAV